MTWIWAISGALALIGLALLAGFYLLHRSLSRATQRAEAALAPFGRPMLSSTAWRAVPAPVGVGVLRLYSDRLAFGHGLSQEVWEIPLSDIASARSISEITTDLGTTTPKKPALQITTVAPVSDSDGPSPNTDTPPIHVFAIETGCEPWVTAVEKACAA